MMFAPIFLRPIIRKLLGFKVMDDKLDSKNEDHRKDDIDSTVEN
jgi:hypothetical protein